MKSGEKVHLIALLHSGNTLAATTGFLQQQSGKTPTMGADLFFLLRRIPTGTCYPFEKKLFITADYLTLPANASAFPTISASFRGKKRLCRSVRKK